MRYLMLGIVVGLLLGTAASLGAQRATDAQPCAHAWIAWALALDGVTWQPIGAVISEADCQGKVREIRQAHEKDRTPPSLSCFPDTFDPRPKK